MHSTVKHPLLLCLLTTFIYLPGMTASQAASNDGPNSQTQQLTKTESNSTANKSKAASGQAESDAKSGWQFPFLTHKPHAPRRKPKLTGPTPAEKPAPGLLTNEQKSVRMKRQSTDAQSEFKTTKAAADAQKQVLKAEMTRVNETMKTQEDALTPQEAQEQARSQAELQAKIAAQYQFAQSKKSELKREEAVATREKAKHVYSIPAQIACEGKMKIGSEAHVLVRTLPRANCYLALNTGSTETTEIKLKPIKANKSGVADFKFKVPEAHRGPLPTAIGFLGSPGHLLVKAVTSLDEQRHEELKKVELTY
jgi:hypothetical protein